MLANSVAKSFIKKAHKRQKNFHVSPSEPVEEKTTKSNAPIEKTTKQKPIATETTDSKNPTVIHDLLKFTSIYKKAEKLYNEDEQRVIAFKLQKDRDAQYYDTMIKKGTLNDKINSLSLLIQKDPSRGLNYLGQIMKEAKKHNRKQAEVAILALKELFINHLLQDNTKLSAFQYNPRIMGKTDSEIPNFDLIDSYYDHCIKEIYRDYIMEVLVRLSSDDLDYFKKLSLDIMVELISSKPEIEEVILGILINKLGDSSKKVQQHAISVLCKLLKDQREMASVIIHET